MNAPYAPEPLANDPGFSLRQLVAFLRRMRRAWPYGLIAIGLGACGFSAYLYFRSPLYRSETVLLYSQGVGVGDPETASTNPRNASARLKEVLMSRPKLAEIVTTFSLYPDVKQKYGMEDAVEDGSGRGIGNSAGTPTRAGAPVPWPNRGA